MAVVDDTRVYVCVFVHVSIGLLQRLEYGEAKVERFFVAPTAMDIINRDRARNGTGMLQVLDAAIGVRRLIASARFHPIKHAVLLSGS